MATATSKACCFICSKEISTYKCGGCAKDFCFTHLTEHRQTVSKQFDAVENDRNLFRQLLIEQKEDPKIRPLIQQIDTWEEDSIKKIKQTTEECKQMLFEHTNKYIIQMEIQLTKLTEQLKATREKDEFNEIDLNEIKTQLTKLTTEFDQPPNIYIQQHSSSFISKISVIVSSERFSSTVTNMHSNTKWKQNGIVIAAGNEKGNKLNQLSGPYGIYVDDDQTIYIADSDNHRIVSWKCNSKNGEIVAGGKGEGNRTDQLNSPTDVIMDKVNDTLIICDYGNRRVVRWSRRNNTSGDIIISDIDCLSVTMDNSGSLYVSDGEKNEVRRWVIGKRSGTIVAGGNGPGSHLNQLNDPRFIFVSEDFSVYVSDRDNNRVMKWTKGAKEGIIVAGGRGQGNSLTQLYHPQGVIVDQLGHVYVVDEGNHRVMRWCKGATEGNILVGRNGQGKQSNQFNSPGGLSFDGQGNLYVVDYENDRIQKFQIDSN